MTVAMQIDGALTFEPDLNDRLSGRVWMAIVAAALTRQHEGLVVCDAHLGVVFASQRALELLAHLGMGSDRALPESVVEILSDQMADGDAQRSDVLPTVNGCGPVAVGTSALEGLPGSAQVVVFLRQANE